VVTWTGSDDPGGSGIAFYDIYVSDNGGAYQLFVSHTTLTSATFTGVQGHTYGFYSVATDNVGNVEPTPAVAQAGTTVGQAAQTPTNTAVTSDHPGGATYGEIINFTATVTPNNAGTGIPTGTILFLDGGTILGAAFLDAQGRASIASAALTAGSHTVTAVYSGDANFVGLDTTALDQVVNPAGTSITLVSNQGAAVYGQAILFTATASAVAPGTGLPTGTVIFFDGSTILGSVNLDSTGQATLSATTLGAGLHSVSAAYAGDNNFLSSTSTFVAESISQGSTTTAIVSANTSTVYGQVVTFTATVSPVGPAGGVPTGTVTFLDGATVLGTATLDASGNASFPTTALALGNHSVTAVYGADANFTGSTSAAVAQIVNPAATSTALAPSQNPSAPSQPLTLTATVTAVAPGGGVPTGTVTFQDGNTILGTAPVDAYGQAAFTTTGLGIGSHTITAAYAGDGNYIASVSDALALTVDAGLTGSATTLDSSAAPSVYGQAVTFTATVSVPSGTATGTVTFMDGATVLAAISVDASGHAAFTTTTALAVGSHRLTAIYSGDATFAGSTSAILTQSVNTAATATTWISAAGSSAFGQAVALTAAVGPVAPGAGLPTGTVTFLDGATVLGTVVLDGTGQASLTTAALAVGSHNLTVVYAGDGNFSTSTSTALTQTVTPAVTSTTVTTSLTPSAPGQALTFTATVQVTGPGAGTPTGTVTFKDVDTILGTVPVDGTGHAVFVTADLGVGSHAITASYDGDGNFAGSTSAILTQVVSADLTATTTALSTSVASAVYGQSVTLTATVTPTSGLAVPTQTVTFKDGDTVLGTASLDAQGRAVLVISQLSAGSHRITASYSGDPSFTASTSPVLTQTVNRDTTTTTVTSSSPTSVYGQSVTFTATVTPDAPGSGIPTGRVTFLDGGTVLGAVTLDAQGRAVLSTALLGAGSHTITAVYSGDANFSARNVISQTQVVHRAGTSITLVSDNNPATVGQAVTFTATVTPVAPGAGTPTGTVTFRDGSTVLGTATIDSAGHAQWTISTLALGSHPITVSYDGDLDFDQSVSDLLTQVIDM
jgi:hypothetical protein